MKPESVAKAEAETASPEHNQSGSEGKGSVKGRPHSRSHWGGVLFSQSNATTDNVAATGDKAKPQNGVAQFPPPKTDKPRPHVCGTCSRSFARLEHLKRHERSHTKRSHSNAPNVQDALPDAIFYFAISRSCTRPTQHRQDLVPEGGKASLAQQSLAPATECARTRWLTTEACLAWQRTV